jgi:hypothetical protein
LHLLYEFRLHKFVRELTLALEDPSSIKDWNRLADMPLPPLGQIFLKRYEVSDKTRALQVHQHAAVVEFNADPLPTKYLAHSFMRQALELNAPDKAMNRFAELIRAGADIAKALQTTIEEQERAATEAADLEMVDESEQFGL